MTDNELCKICGVNPVDLSMLVCKECSSKATNQPKVLLWIEDVEISTRSTGIVRLSPSILKEGSVITKDDTVVCGTWGRNANNTVWIRLLEPIAALQDQTTLLLIKLQERRKRGLSTGPTLKPPTLRELGGSRAKTTKKKPIGDKRPTEETPGVGSAVSASMQALRDKLRSKA